MTSRVVPDSDEQIIADLIRLERRLTHEPSASSVRGGHDLFTVAATPLTDYPLTYIPVDGTCEVALNGLELREGTDFTCDYDLSSVTAGHVTVSASLVPGDKLVARYLLTDWLVARSLPAECETVYSACDTVTDAFNRSDYGDGTLGFADTGQRWVNPPGDEGHWTTQGTTPNTAQAVVPVLDHYRVITALIDTGGNNIDLTVDGDAADDNSAGLFIRCTADLANGYWIYTNAYSGGITPIYKFTNGVATRIHDFTGAISPNTPFTLRVIALDNTLEVILAGSSLGSITIDPDDSGGNCETDWTYCGLSQDHGGSGGSAPTQLTVYTNTHWDNLSVVAP